MVLSLNDLSLYHFKNYLEKSFSFDKKLVCISGKNGTGKTTILDAIHFLCFTKSYFLYSDSMAVSNQHAGMRIAGHITLDSNHEVVYILRENGKKEFYCDGEQYVQFSKHIGKYPCVFIAPDDTDLISEGSEVRRKFLDVLISQTEPAYINCLIRYNKVLSQRNSLLKHWLEISESEKSLISIYDEQLHEFGTAIYTYRKNIATPLAEKANAIYLHLSDEKESISIEYSSRLSEKPLHALLKENIHKDIASQRTNYGIHKDDLVFSLNGMPFKQAASQGQRKSFLFGLKLAEYDWIMKSKQLNPILLLDDIFEKLDEQRSRKLIDYIAQLNTQVFVTDTHIDRLKSAFESYESDCQFIEL
jgi:DNA replication and repair protein RecF